MNPMITLSEYAMKYIPTINDTSTRREPLRTELGALDRELVRLSNRPPATLGCRKARQIRREELRVE